MAELPDISQEPMMHIDGTPNEDYPLRILRTHRQNCDCRWTSDLERPLVAAMNKMYEQRAIILDKAIAILEQALKAPK